jgi:ketosteroid isomerase-like protein
MQRSLGLVGALLLLFCAVSFAQIQPAPADVTAEAQAGVTAFLKGQVQAWNRGDLKAFMEGYWKSPEVVFVSGTHYWRGWDLINRWYHNGYDNGGSEMGKMAMGWSSPIHVLAPDLAYVDGDFQLTTSDGKQDRRNFSLILRKFPEGWRIVHDRTCSD